MNDKTYGLGVGEDQDSNLAEWALAIGTTLGILGFVAVDQYSQEPSVREETRNTPAEKRVIETQDLDPQKEDGNELAVLAVEDYDTFTEEGVRFVYRNGEGETESFMAPTGWDERTKGQDHMRGEVYRLPDGGYLAENEFDPDSEGGYHSQTLLEPEGDGYRREELEEDEFYDTSDLQEVDVEKYLSEEEE